MIYNININQHGIIDNFPDTKLRIHHFAILEAICKLRDTNWVEKYIEDELQYLWISTKLLQTQIPLLGVSEKQIKRYILALVEEGFITRSDKNEVQGKMLLHITYKTGLMQSANKAQKTDKNNSNFRTKRYTTPTQKCTDTLYKSGYYNFNDNNINDDNEEYVKEKEIYKEKEIEEAELFSAVDVSNNSFENGRKKTILEFDELWEMYQKKEGKEAAKKLYAKIKEKDREIIKVHVPIYVRMKSDVKYRKQLRTYLNERVWLDEDVDNLFETAERMKENNVSRNDLYL